MYEEIKMRVFLLFIMIIFNFYSCDFLKEKGLMTNVFEAKKYGDWVFTHRLAILNQHYFNKDEPILRPYLTWQLLPPTVTQVTQGSPDGTPGDPRFPRR